MMLPFVVAGSGNEGLAGPLSSGVLNIWFKQTAGRVWLDVLAAPSMENILARQKANR
jgi:hypothetical protein